jgi:signal transduction histidine kinase
VGARADAARRAGLQLELTLPDPADVAEVDVAGMRRVIDILLDNAIRHTPRGGRVRLAAEVHAGGLRLEVADTGTGIPPDHLIRLFDRSWLARSSRPGRGVGLLVVKGMIEAHGGNLFVDSQPGRGTHFTCLVPRRRMARAA